MTGWVVKCPSGPSVGDALFTVYACQALQTLARADAEEDGPWAETAGGGKFKFCLFSRRQSLYFQRDSKHNLYRIYMYIQIYIYIHIIYELLIFHCQIPIARGFFLT